MHSRYLRVFKEDKSWNIANFVVTVFTGGSRNAYQDRHWPLTHWGSVTHTCVSKIIIIVSDDDLSPGWCQAIIWTNAGILLIGPLGIDFGEILIETNTFSFTKMHLKMSSAKWHLFRLGLNELRQKSDIRQQGVMTLQRITIQLSCCIDAELDKDLLVYISNGFSNVHCEDCWI